MTKFAARAARLILVVVAAAQLGGCGFNNIPTLDEQAKTEFSNLQAAYQRRADLIPNLVATVQGAATQERTTLREVIEARSRATSIQVTPEMVSDPEAMARFEAAQNQLSGALSRLLVVSENYPVLQSNQNFLNLQNELERTENRINISRRDYNEAARRLNTEMRTFPGVLWAKTMHSGVDPARQFQAAATAQEAPRVNFNIPGATPPAAGAAQPAAPAGGPAFASP